MKTDTLLGDIARLNTQNLELSTELKDFAERFQTLGEALRVSIAITRETLEKHEREIAELRAKIP